MQRFQVLMRWKNGYLQHAFTVYANSELDVRAFTLAKENRRIPENVELLIVPLDDDPSLSHLTAEYIVPTRSERREGA